jgi:hypothetical protein
LEGKGAIKPKSKYLIFFFSIEIGKDADIVIWERHPLRLGARPKHVIIDGEELDFKKSWGKSVTEQEFVLKQMMEAESTKEASTENERHYLPPFSQNTMRLEDHGLNNPESFHDACASGVESFVLRNISEIYMNASNTLSASELGQGLYIVVKEGKISCIGIDCDRDHVEWPNSSPVFEMGGAVVIPVSKTWFISVYDNAYIQSIKRVLCLWVYLWAFRKFKQRKQLKMVMLKTMLLTMDCTRKLYVLLMV